MKIINKIFLISLFLCCYSEKGLAELFKLRNSDNYIQIKGQEVLFTNDKCNATDFILMDKFSPPYSLIFSMTFSIAYTDQNNPANNLFLVCKDNNQLSLISEEEHQSHGYFWQALIRTESCICHNKTGDVFVDLVLSIV